MLEESIARAVDLDINRFFAKGTVGKLRGGIPRAMQRGFQAALILIADDVRYMAK